MLKTLKIHRPAEVCKILGISKSTLYRLSKDKGFPQKILIGGRAVGYASNELQDFINQRKLDRS